MVIPCVAVNVPPFWIVAEPLANDAESVVRLPKPPRSIVPLFWLMLFVTVRLAASVIEFEYSLMFKFAMVVAISTEQFGVPARKPAVSPGPGTVPNGPPAQLFGLLQTRLLPTVPVQVK